MTVLVGAIEIQRLVPSRPLDDHGWADKNPLVVADPVQGSIQERLPGPQPDGDFGAWEPGSARRGVAYVDTECNPGDVLSVEGVLWRVLDARFVRDPMKRGNDCWLSQVEQIKGVMIDD